MTKKFVCKTKLKVIFCLLQQAPDLIQIKTKTFSMTVNIAKNITILIILPFTSVKGGHPRNSSI